MDKKEFALIAAKLKTFYPKDDVFPNDATGAAVQLWYNALMDIPADVLNLAVDKWVALNKWPPKVSELRAMAADICSPVPAGWGEAWEQVQKAIRNHGIWGETAALESMDELTRRAVQSMGFKTICLSENPAADRAHFQRIYERLEKAEKENRALPVALIGAICNQKELENESRRLLGTTE